MKTKSYLFAAASATLMLASCTQNEVVEMPATRAIGFGTYVGNTSRAVSDTDLDFLKGDGNGFYVFGSYMDGATEIAVFNGTSDESNVTWKGTLTDGSWGYSPLNYWSEGKQYKFAAYGPKASLAKGTPSFNYVNNTLSIQKFTADGTLDLVVAEGQPGGYSLAENQTTMDPVRFKFFHALSKVRFTLKNGWRNHVNLAVRNVKVSGLSKTADLTTTGQLAEANNPIPAAQWSKLDETKGEYAWTDTFESSVFNQDSNHNYPETGDPEENIRYEYFIMPQTLAADAVTLTLECKVTTDNGSNILFPNPDDIVNDGYKVVTVNIPVNNISAWVPGTAYNYTLTIDGSTFDLKPIQFDTVEMVEWVNAQDQPIPDPQP